jgi:hypothetical protein
LSAATALSKDMSSSSCITAQSGPGRCDLTTWTSQLLRRSLNFCSVMQRPPPESAAALRLKSPSLSVALSGARHELEAIRAGAGA